MKRIYVCILETAHYDRHAFEAAIAGLALQLKEDFAPAHDRDPMGARVAEWMANESIPLEIPVAGEVMEVRPLHFRDSTATDPAGALAYHTVEDGRPAAHILVDRILASSGPDDISEAASHEMIEIEGNEYGDEWSDRGDGTEEPHELCDRLQGSGYFKELKNCGQVTARVKVANFLYPEAFNDEAPAGAQFDHMRAITYPRDKTPDGYFIARPVNGAGVTTVMGSVRHALAFSLGALERHGVDVAALRGEKKPDAPPAPPSPPAPPVPPSDLPPPIV